MADSTNFTALTSNKKRKASDSTESLESQPSPQSSNITSESGGITSESSLDSSPFEVLTCTSTWNKNTLDKLKIVTTTTTTYTPMQLVSRAYKEYDSEMDQQIKKFKEHILVRSPLHMLDVDSFERIEMNLAFKMRSWINQFTINDPWNKATEVEKGNDFRLWHMFHTNGEQFGQQLVYMSMKQRSKSLTEYMYQMLFQHFVGMFGLSFISCPQLDGCKIKIGSAEVTSIPDVIFPCLSKNEEELEVIAVCEIKKYFKEENQTSPRQTRAEKKAKVRVIHHLDDKLLGQLGGELLAHLPFSKNQRGILGIVVQATCVTFCHLDCTPEQFDEIKTGRPNLSVKPEICFTKPYNFLKASDRQELIEPFLKLGFIQCMSLK